MIYLLLMCLLFVRVVAIKTSWEYSLTQNTLLVLQDLVKYLSGRKQNAVAMDIG